VALMPYTSLPTVSADQAVRASWGNLVDSNLDDLHTRIVTLEGAGGTGDVVGPASATATAIARYDGTTGKLIKNSGITIADAATGSLSGSNSGDVTLAGTPNYLTLVAQVLTRGLINLASHVTGRLPFANLTAATAANRLLGRGSAGGAGDWEEITIGSGLAYSANTLTATGGSGGAPVDALYVSLATDATLTNERVLTGTSNQITITDGGAGAAVTLSTPQNIHTGATPQFARMGVAVAADASAKLKIAGQYGSTTVAAGSSGTSKTLDWDDGNTQLLTLTGNCTLTLSNPKDGFRYLIALLQDGTGTRTVTWPSAVKWQAGVAPTLSTVAGKVDIVTLVWMSALGASGNYLAAANTDYTPA
jgi:hypothetical protein